MRSEKFCEVLKGIQAIFARLLFLIHSVFVIWGATCVTGRKDLWTLTVLCALFIVETIYCIAKRQGREPKWFSLCVFIYLLAAVPPLWMIHLDLLSCQMLKHDDNEDCAHCTTGIKGANFTVCAVMSFSSLSARKTFVYTTEQLMLLILILGRWMLPKGVISRDQLSQLLLIYFGVSFDIMELFLLFDEPQVIASRPLQYVILAVWSGSLLQFTLVLTTTKTRRPRLLREMRGGRGLLHRLTQCRCCHTEIWGLLAIVVLQDGPFLVLRLYCFGMGIFTYNLLFYTFKNGLILILEAYRIAVLVLRCSRPGFDERPPRSELLVTVIAPICAENGFKNRGHRRNELDRIHSDEAERTNNYTGRQRVQPKEVNSIVSV